MADRTVQIWFDPQGDFLEVIFDQKSGHFQSTADEQVLKKVDEGGSVIGFMILRVSSLKKGSLNVSLP